MRGQNACFFTRRYAPSRRAAGFPHALRAPYVLTHQVELDEIGQ
jgi:hypothetical protein